MTRWATFGKGKKAHKLWRPISLIGAPIYYFMWCGSGVGHNWDELTDAKPDTPKCKLCLKLEAKRKEIEGQG